MHRPKWLSILETVGVAALEASPLKPIAPQVKAAIIEAEAIAGAKGEDKLAHVLNASVKAAEVAQAEGAHISPALVEAAGASAISTAVNVTNLVHAANQHVSVSPPAA